MKFLEFRYYGAEIRSALAPAFPQVPAFDLDFAPALALALALAFPPDPAFVRLTSAPVCGQKALALALAFPPDPAFVRLSRTPVVVIL